ncbi:MAG: hypothetical protein HOQ01_13380 [Lysobacter sp.]|nr:hypothetical protein [Lysobacter sp.]
MLKATPPRMPRAALERAHLRDAFRLRHDRTALTVVAPAGFGKTTLLLQWRRWWHDEDTRVAWLTAGEDDRPARFTLALQHALRLGGVLADQARPERASRPDTIAELTTLLASIAALGTNVGLVIDEAERLPDDTVRGPLQYLLLNAPANLHIAIGTRVALPLLLSELAAKDQSFTLKTEDLRLRLEESLEILAVRLGDRLTLDERARVHGIADGWAIGLQLAISAIESEPDPARAVQHLSARHGAMQEYFVTSLFARLPPETSACLVRASILEHFDANLFQAVSGARQTQDMLDRLARETPILGAGEGTQWMRLHPLARDFLLGKFEKLSSRERSSLHTRASKWYADRERWHEAATHAFAAGDDSLAQAYAARSLWALSTVGKLTEAREWLERLPHDMVAGDTDLRLVAASVLAFSDRNDEALEFARDVLDDRDATPQARAHALRTAAGSAVFGDRLGLLPALIEQWPMSEEGGGGPLYTLAGLNTRAVLALHAGDGGQVRALVTAQQPYGDAGTLRLAAALGRMLGALSHLWEGHPVRAEAALLPALLHAERDGRRGMIACLHASVIAAARYERGEAAQAEALLADRLDVIERHGFPDNLICAYRTLANIKLEAGDEAGALAALHTLESLGARRGAPRLQAIAIAHQVRVHAMNSRKETVARTLDALDQLAPAFETPEMLPLRTEYRLAVAFARARAALMGDRFDAAELHLADADLLAETLQRGNDVQRVKVLRGIVASRRGDPKAMVLLREAHDLAALAGNARLAADTHPLAASLLEEALGARPPLAQTKSRDRHARAAMLTSKEAEVLDLLGKGMPNKAIARALDVSGETVKWHLKNLFVKLSAGSRRHAVERARMLGLVT